MALEPVYQDFYGEEEVEEVEKVNMPAARTLMQHIYCGDGGTNSSFEPERFLGRLVVVTEEVLPGTLLKGFP